MPEYGKGWLVTAQMRNKIWKEVCLKLFKIRLVDILYILWVQRCLFKNYFVFAFMGLTEKILICHSDSKSLNSIIMLGPFEFRWIITLNILIETMMGMKTVYSFRNCSFVLVNASILISYSMGKVLGISCCNIFPRNVNVFPDSYG